MTLLVLGINHTSASLEFREQVVFAPETTTMALQRLTEDMGIAEAAILSTCNRTEIYLAGSCHHIGRHILQWVADYHQLDIDTLADRHYYYHGEGALEHMMKVACGLDSMILGEPQILGQMKSCYATAESAGVLGSALRGAFQQIFSTAKQVRTQTAIGANPVSVAYAAVTLAQQIFSDLSRQKTLLIGAGKTIELVARHLQDKRAGAITFANRTLDRAHKLASQFAGEAMLLADIPPSLHRADIVISSTASQLPILGKGAVESALKQRKRKPMFMVDIAVPRDIEAQVDDLEDVYLYTVDDLRDVIDENIKSRQSAAAEAGKIIAANIALYQQVLRTRDSVSTIKAYRKQAEAARDQVLSKALRDLANGGEPARVVEQMANRLTNKLLHTPTSNLKQAGAEGRHDIIELSRQLFGLDQHSLDTGPTDRSSDR